MKTLILVPRMDFYFFNHLRSDDMEIHAVFPVMHGIKSVLCKLFRKIGCDGSSWFYGDWWKSLDQFDKIIVFDSALSLDDMLMHNIAKKSPRSHRFIYSWNVVRNEKALLNDLAAAARYGFEYYSYDQNDCNKYQLKFNTIMYDPSYLIDRSNHIQCDTIFLGFVKDRKTKLLSLYSLLSRNGLQPRFVVIDNDLSNADVPFEVRRSYVPYQEYTQWVSRSRAIIDITQSGQNGFSMRIMEAIFGDKKLISTNSALRYADFYDPNNIFIIDLDHVDEGKLREFMDSDFHPYDKAVKSYYSIAAWVNRFDIDE